MRSVSRFLAILSTAAALTVSLSAQNVPFQLTVLGNQNSSGVSNGQAVTVPASAIGTKVVFTVSAVYLGTNIANLQVPQLFGSSAFTFTSPPVATTLNPGMGISIPVTFIPTSGAQVTSSLSIAFTENGAGGAVNSGVISLNLVGTAPAFVVSYFFQPAQNVFLLTDGSTLNFPTTPVPGSSQAVVQIQNLGTGAGLINSINVTGAAFTTTSVPLLPGSLNSGATLQFNVVYTPVNSGSNTGTMVIAFPDHTVTVNLAGTGTAPSFVYQLVVNGQASTIQPNQSVALASAPGITLPFTINVQNSGTGSGTIGGESLSGAGMALINGPALPIVLTPGGLATFSFAFTPPQAGSFGGFLRIGNDSFTLAASGTGPVLTYSFAISSNTVAVATGGNVPFSAVQVGQSVAGTFTIHNSGTAPDTVLSIFMATQNSAFALSAIPSLPLTLPVGGTSSFTITFTPIATGTNNGTLEIDNAVFNLAGPGTAPPALPQFSYSGGGSSGPLQQPAIGLALATPYAVAINGTLTIAQNPLGFAPDPSVLFSNGTANVTFTIPANTTQAIFPNGASSIRLQTGSVANTITVTPTFSTAGGFNLTPVNPLTLQFTVPSSPPQLSGVAITQVSEAGITLQISGLVTSRSLSSLEFTFVGQPNFNLANATLKADISSLATNWFQSANSDQSGGQFSIVVPFAFASSSTGVTNTVAAIQSVSVTASNGQGTSGAVSTQIP